MTSPFVKTTNWNEDMDYFGENISTEISSVPEELKERYSNLLLRLEKQIFENHIENFFGKYKVYFITLNPSIDESQLQKDIVMFRKKFKKKEIAYSTWNYEMFVSSDKYPKRLHSHAIVIAKRKHGFHKYTRMTPSWCFSPSGFTCKRLSKSSVQLGDEKKPLDKREIKSLEDLKFRLAYINGYKRDKDKLKLVDKDKQWRKKMNLPDTEEFLKRTYNNELDHSQLVKYINKLLDDAKNEWNTWLNNKAKK